MVTPTEKPCAATLVFRAKTGNLDVDGYDGPPGPLQPAERKTLEALADRKTSRFKAWAWKDPRTVLFLAEYRRIIPGAFYLVVMRHYPSVVSSLLSRKYKRKVQKNDSGPALRRWI
jgi:hypothetical protein